MFDLRRLTHNAVFLKIVAAAVVVTAVIRKIAPPNTLAYQVASTVWAPLSEAAVALGVYSSTTNPGTPEPLPADSTEAPTAQ